MSALWKCSYTCNRVRVYTFGLFWARGVRVIVVFIRKGLTIWNAELVVASIVFLEMGMNTDLYVH